MFNLIPFSTNEPDVFDYFDTFDRFFTRPIAASSYVQFKTDVAETKDSFLLSAELPGFSKEEINIELKEDVLTITASHKEEKEQTDETKQDASKKEEQTPAISYLRKERQEVSYKRCFHIESIDSSGIKANYNNGILELTLPKIMPKEPERIKIDVA